MQAQTRYELRQIEQYISTRKKSHGQKSELSQEILDELLRIRDSLLDQVLVLDEHHLQLYIAHYETTLVRLMDETFQSSTIMYQQLDSLLTFIERNFKRYFNYDQKAPTGRIEVVRAEMRPATVKITDALLTMKADVELISVSTQALTRINNGSHAYEISFRKLHFAIILQRELTQFIYSDHTNVNETLSQMLLHLNYNSTAVYLYHTELIRSALISCDSFPERMEKLSYFLKIINQHPQKADMIYKINDDSIKTQLTQYVLEEIAYQQRTAHLADAKALPQDEVYLKDFKIKLDLSVAHLALLIKLFTDTRIIVDINLSAMFPFFAKFFISKKTDELSAAGLRTKFYNVAPGTVKSLRSMLISMITHLDKNF